MSLSFDFEKNPEEMGIKKDFHNKGIGKEMIDFIINFAQKNKYKYLEVKTLDESRESEEYKITRNFYLKVGFLPIDVLKNEWGEKNPCLLMLMDIENRHRRTKLH